MPTNFLALNFKHDSRKPRSGLIKKYCLTHTHTHTHTQRERERERKKERERDLLGKPYNFFMKFSVKHMVWPREGFQLQEASPRLDFLKHT